MPSLVERLQATALDENTSVSDLLRLAMTVARKLDLFEIDEFLKHELHGYPDDADVPAHRVVRGACMARNAVREVPIIFEDPKERDAVQLRSVRYSASELERLATGERERLVYPLPSGLTSHRTFSYVAISKSDLHGILDKVRTAVLEWALTLEEKGITGVGVSFKPTAATPNQSKQYVAVD